MRSKLFVPGSRPELFGKALASSADAISIDLEDAVLVERKGEARSLVATFLRSPEVLASDKVFIVRVNGVHTTFFEADVDAVADRRLAMINLPKVESVEQVRAAVGVIERVEARAGIADPIRLLANIESPEGLRCAGAIAAAHPRIAGLQLGYADLFEPLGIDRCDRANVHATLFAVRMAAGAAGIFAYDGAFANVQDAEGFRAEAVMARRLGFWGKSCIHPSQVALANEVFMPDQAAVADALRVISAWEHARAQGAGAFMLDGRMIDAPYVGRARAIVAIDRGKSRTSN